jgi:diguanylate cyclase (GGDEF)-like protein/PAS domain S-box-containing protein
MQAGGLSMGVAPDHAMAARAVSIADDDEPDLRFRRELVLAFGLFQLAVSALAGISELTGGNQALAFLYLVGLLPIVGVLIWLRRGGVPAHAGSGLLVTIYALVTATNLATGGQAIGANLALPTVALFGVLMSPPRQGLLWLALVVLQIVVVALLRRSDYDFPLQPDAAWVSSAIDRVPLIFSLASGMIGWMILRALAQYRQRLDQSQQSERLARSAASHDAQRFAEFAEIAADGFWEVDDGLQLRYVSPGFAAQLGVQPAQMQGQSLSSAYARHSAHSLGVAEVEAEMLQRRAFYGQRITTRGRDGVESCLSLQGRPVLDDNGVFCGYRGTVHDISEQLRAQAALKASEQRLRLITDNVPALISYIDADRRFRFNNREYSILLDRPLEEITGKLLVDVYSAETFAKISPQLEHAFSGEAVNFEVEANGRIMRVAYLPDLDDNGVARGVYGLIHDISALKKIERELRTLSQFDALTGLANRRRYNERLADAIDRSERRNELLALMFLDLDHFKSVNDSLGHKAGDQVLQEFARRIERSVRNTDTVARLAGDEFVIVLESVQGRAEAERVAEKILQAMTIEFQVDGGARRLTASIGITLRKPGELDGEALLRRADSALYAAKDAGRNRYEVA